MSDRRDRDLPKETLPSAAFDVVGFDADDTLWHDISTYMRAKDAFLTLLERYQHRDAIDRRLDVTEERNLQCFGYGAKGFIISMIETAIDMTDGRISAGEISAIIDFGKHILNSPVTPLPGVEQTVAELASVHRLIVITKGDLFDQETKMARSGLGDYFSELHVVSEKTVASYARLLKRHSIEPERFLMIGNSLKSDVLPVIELGGWAIHIPYEITWFIEHADMPESPKPRQFNAAYMHDIPMMLRNTTASAGPGVREIPTSSRQHQGN